MAKTKLGALRAGDWAVRLLLISLVLAISCSKLTDKLGGDFAGGPEDLAGNIGAEAEALIADAFRNVDPARLLDFHVHLIGLGSSGSGAFINPRLDSLWHPFDYIRTSIYKSAAGIEDDSEADAQYLARLRALIRHIPQGRYAIMAFDKHYREDGTVDLERTPFFMPNDIVYGIARENPVRFVPMISVHPYRSDALRELEKWAERGVRLVKWLPNAMGIDPSDERIDPFYSTMVRHGMILLTHTGEEQAVDAEDRQALGNPLLLRRPLERGVTVIMAHSASLGSAEDIESPGKPRVPNFQLFLRMMDDPRYVGRLYGEISGLTQYNRFDGPLQTLLERSDLHPRLVNGSDYPLPAVNVVVRTEKLSDAGFITEAEREALNEIYRYNPLLFDFVLKRTLRHPQTGVKFPPEVFMSPFPLP